MHGRESTDTAEGHIGIRTSGEQYIRVTQTNLVKRRGYCVRRRRACGRYGETEATQTEANGYMSGRNAGDGFRDHEGVETRYAVAFGEVDDLLFGRQQSAHTASPDHAYAAAVLLLQVQPAIAQSLVGHAHGELRITVHPMHLFLVDYRRRVKTLDFTGKLRLILRRIEGGDRSDTILAIHQRTPCLRSGITNRR